MKLVIYNTNKVYNANKIYNASEKKFVMNNKKEFAKCR